MRAAWPRDEVGKVRSGESVIGFGDVAGLDDLRVLEGDSRRASSTASKAAKKVSTNPMDVMAFSSLRLRQ